MKLLTRYGGLLALILIMSILIVGRYGELLQWSTNKVIEPYGDGFKNYTCIQYHAQNDTTYTFYEGMNYPYREHAASASTQPLTSNTLKFLSNFFGDLSRYTIPVVNHSMLVSILLTAIFLFLIFKEQDLPDWYSVLAAVGITFLAPQTHRMISHYGLAHPEVIPALIYFYLKFSKTSSIKWSFAIAAVLFLYPLIHFYYFPISVFLISLLFLFSFLGEMNWRKFRYYALHYGIQVGLPLLFFIYWIIILDPVADRTVNQWGYLEYSAKLQGLFTSLTQPHYRWIDQNIISFRSLDFEAKSYFGVIGTLFSLVLLISLGSRLLGRSNFIPVIPAKRVMNRLFFSSFLLLLLALGLPFIIPGLEFLLDHTGPLQQFRSTGRFAWPMFYVINIMAFIYLFEWSGKGQFWYRRLLPFLAFFILFFEAYHFSYAQDYGLEEIEQLKEGQRYTDNNIDFSKYQAILPIPYYNMGSGNFWWPYGYSFSLQQSQILSLQTSLPVTASLVNRSSPTQAIKQLQLALEPYRKPVVLEDYPNNKPLLLLWDHTHQERPEYKDQYQHFENEGRTVYDQGPIRLAELSLESFEKRIQARKERIQEEIKTDSLFESAEFLASQPDKDYVYESFDDQNSDKPYLGKGGLEFEMGKKATVFKGQIPAGRSAQSYELLVWMYINRDLNARSMVELEEVDLQGNTVRQQSTMAWRLVKIIDDTGWAMLKLTFELQNPENTIILSLTNTHLRKKMFYLDELLIKPPDLDLYKDEASFLWKNNLWFPKN